ncbi:general odorant-binding protein 99a-like [Drosophila eugracilis]|uniref:general odorant-binding protein 99a-like n=1 Tax=Drosophila eugracilis TaxID=29029 RepID=UPI001BDA043D|nr:general odorant-binding protein 99a-like [Drosophila eugracilis]
MLKYLIVTLALCAVGKAEDWKPKHGMENAKIQMDCLQENPLSSETRAQLRNVILPDEPDVRKYLTCMAIKWGIFSEQHGYNAERLAKQLNLGLPEEEALQIAQGCIDDNSQKSPTDVWAFRGNQCVMASKIGDTIKAFMEAEMKRLPRGRM